MDCLLELNMKPRYLQLGDESRDDFDKLIANPRDCRSFIVAVTLD